MCNNKELTPEILIVIEGGIIQNVVSNIPVRYLIVDYDVEDESNLICLNGSNGFINTDISSAEVDKSEVDKYHNAVKNTQIDGVFALVWIHETEKWHYFKETFDKNQFPNGFVDYYVTVKKGIIQEDTYKTTHKGELFSQIYDINWWK